MRNRSNLTTRIRHLTLLTLIAVFLVQPVAAAAANDHAYPSYRTMGLWPGGVRQSFSFVVASDSHVGYGPATEKTSVALDDMVQRYPGLSFMVHMGDLTETGSDAEYRQVKSLTASLPFPVIATMGNHEARWQDPQGSLFRTYMGSPNTSFNYGAWHFVVLDTSYPGETLGTLDPATIAWLESDLAANRGRPVAVFSHHPLLYAEQEFQDSDDAFARVMDKYPVRVVFSGHGHSFIKWQAQGQRFQMVGALMDGAYAQVSIEGLNMTVRSVAPLQDGKMQEQAIWQAQVAPAAALAPANPVSSVTAAAKDGVLTASLELSRAAEVYFRIDNGGYNAVGTLPAGTNPFTLDVSRQAKGIHTLGIKAVMSEGPFFSSVEFEKDAVDLLIWRTDFGSAVTGDILQKGVDQAIIGTRDGLLRNVRLVDGEVLWTFDAGSTWGGGVLDGHRLYFGTAAGDLYCMNADDGTFSWKVGMDKAGFMAAPALAATPAGKLVVAASTSGKVYGLNAFYGGKVWQFQAKGAVQSSPVASGGRVYFGSWDTSLYALDAASGNLLWSASLGRQVYYAPYLTPAVSGNRVFATVAYDSSAGGSILYALDASNGEVLWKVLGKSSFMSPTASPGRPVTVMDGSGTVSAFSQGDGRLEWTKPGSGTLFGNPPGDGPLFITGGYRGVLGFLGDDGRADYAVRDSHLFVSPLLTTTPGANRKAAALVADTRGSSFLLAFPK